MRKRKNDKLVREAIDLSDARNLLDTINKLANTVNTTTNPDAFFSSFDEMIEKLTKLSKYNKKIFNQGTSPEEDLKKILQSKDKTTEVFIDRCYNSVSVKDKYYLIGKYVDRLSDENRKHFENNLDKLDSISAEAMASSEKGLDEKLMQAIDVIFEIGQASVSTLQRRLKLGYSAAAKLIDQMEQLGIVGPFEGSMPRRILMDRTQYLAMSFNIAKPQETLQKHYDSMDGHEFERFCANLLKKNGYMKTEVTKGSGDHGADVLAEKDGVTYVIQCKRYDSNIGNKAVQEVFTAKTIFKRHIGIVLTNQYFTKAAKEAAEQTGVLLWDRDKLEEMVAKA